MARLLHFRQTPHQLAWSLVRLIGYVVLVESEGVQVWECGERETAVQELVVVQN